MDFCKLVGAVNIFDMEIFVYRKDAEQVEEGFTREDLPELLADQTNVVWVDLQGETVEQLEEAKDVMLNVFKFHHLTVEDCIETRNQPKVEAYEKYLYFIVHGIKPEETNPSNFATKELDGYLGSNFVVTFHILRFRSIKLVKQHLRSSPFHCKRGAAYLLHHILDELVDLYMPIVDEFDEEINALEDRVFDMGRNGNAVLGDVMDVRRSVARLKRISSRQLEVLYRMSHGEFPQIPSDILPFFRDVHDHLLRISDLSEGYRDLVAGLFDIHFAVIGNRTNDVMKTLAVLSAIILPLSLIAGIYGMNFENMPELKSDRGYFLTLGAMALITVGLLFYFWRRGWIFQGDSEIVVPQKPERSEEGFEKM
ncbi:MAG: magnesium/cobalt transporter CorA [Acidobacteria bacterium]|nr:magnesium/cobalt transporter CorA [Acidobacteriota bacterium]